ncbi:MAG TPA: SRPBCC domain-containing protein [Anaerolineales bacterium]|nr:SRPBCC domain-containing protein [Anaerolineales bacterium]
MPNGFELSIVLPASPEEIYKAWLSSDGHAALTGSPAKVNGKVGGKFTAWDGYISGTTLELEAPRRIVQAWRTLEFPEDAPDSRLEILLGPAQDGTKFILRHSNMPDDQVEDYRQGWQDSYFKPMQEYFGK